MEFNYNKPNVDVNDLLYNAQLIADAFAKTMEDNNCVLMLTIGLHQQIEESIKDIEDAIENVSDTNDIIDKIQITPSNPTTDLLDTIQDTINDLKDKCFKCDLKFPTLKFNLDLSGMLGDLKVQLDLFKKIFKLDKLDLCQPAFALQSSCVPDILRLITLLLTAFISIMALKKLSNISIAAFIKGVLSTLFNKIAQSLKITVDLGSTNIYCLIEMLREIALALPTQENIKNNLSQDELTFYGFYDPINNQDIVNKNFLYNETIENLSKSLDTTMLDLSNVDRELDRLQDDLNLAFDKINKIVERSVNELNEFIESMTGLQYYLSCEVGRSGIEVQEALQIVSELIQVLNMLSSLALALVKKDLREKSCKTNDRINELSEEELSDLLLKDIISENNQSIVEIINSDENALEVIIYDKKPIDTLPKLDLLDCSIEDFVTSHTLPRIIEIARNQLKEEEKRINTTIPSNTYTIRKPSKQQETVVKNIVDLLYVEPDTKVEDKVIQEQPEIINPIGGKGISNVLESVIRTNKKENNLSCKSIEDVLNILESIKR